VAKVLIKKTYHTHDISKFKICNTLWEVLLSKQVNYNQVVVKCHILQECFLQNFKMQKMQNMDHSNSNTLQGPSRAWNCFVFKIQGLLKDPVKCEPCWQQNWLYELSLCQSSVILQRFFNKSDYFLNEWTYSVFQPTTQTPHHIRPHENVFWASLWLSSKLYTTVLSIAWADATAPNCLLTQTFQISTPKFFYCMILIYLLT